MAHANEIFGIPQIQISDWSLDIGVTGKDDDTVVFVAAEHDSSPSNRTFYNARQGEDTLVIELTSEEWEDPDTQAEVLEFYAVLEEAATDGEGSKFFTFESMNLSVKDFERFILLVDGEEVDPRGAIVIDLSTSSVDETIEVLSDVDTDLKTGSGNDTITVGDGDHVIDVGDGDNTVSTGAGSDVIVAGDGDDTIQSGGGADTITIGDGDDYVNAGSGDDTIIAGNGLGDDIIDGNLGNDTVEYKSATNSVFIDLRTEDRSATATISNGTIGDYLASFGYAPDLPVGIATGDVSGVDTDDIEVDVLIDIENAVGGAGNDIITGNASGNVLDGGSDGSDTLYGLGGDDTLIGGPGADIFYGGSGDDTIRGNAGSDTLVLLGESSDYEIIVIDGGRYQITDMAGNGDDVDIFSSIERLVFTDKTVFDYELPTAGPIVGTVGDDILEGTEGSDSIHGLAGNDTIYGYGGGDYLSGGAGSDTIYGGDDEQWDALDYLYDINDGGTEGIVANLVDVGFSEIKDPFGDTDYVTGIEFYQGTNESDTFNGSNASEAFEHHGGNDTINGGGGYDIIYNDAGTLGFRGIEVVFSDTVAGDGTIEVDTTGAYDVFTSIENVSGGQYSDVILGSIGDQDLFDGDGADLLDGGADYDQLDIGGTGAVFIDMLNIASAVELEAFVGIGSLDPDTAARLSSDPDGFYWFTDGHGNLNLARGFEEIVLFRGADDEVWGDDDDNNFYAFAGDDQLNGRGGQDSLFGGLGADYLNGGADMDTLNGGADDDWLLGGSEADVFEFETGDGYDTIEDFLVGVDSLSLLGGLTITLLSEADVGGEVGPDTIVHLSSGETITLLNVSGVGDPGDLVL